MEFMKIFQIQSDWRLQNFHIRTPLVHARLPYLAARGVMGREHMGTEFPLLFPVLLQNEFEAVSKRLIFWVRFHTFHVSTTSLPTRDERTVIFCDPDPVLNFQNSVQD